MREIDSRMLRKHPDLPKGARMLWLTMLSMADFRTGELRHRGHWFSGEEIDKRAELCDETRRKYMHLLRAAGLVNWERERVFRVLKDRLSGHQRMRCVSGVTHYCVAKSPRKDWLSSKANIFRPRRNAFLLKPSPSALEEIGSQSSSEIHRGVGDAGGCVQSVPKGEEKIEPKHHPNKKRDDVSHAPKLSLPEKAKQTLSEKYPGDGEEQISFGLQIISERAFNSQKTPRSENYFIVSYETLRLEETFKDELRWYRGNPLSNGQRTKMNAVIRRAEEESRKTGRNFFECFDELKNEPFEAVLQ